MMENGKTIALYLLDARHTRLKLIVFQSPPDAPQTLPVTWKCVTRLMANV
jgi:hypothetical protein